MAQLFIKQAKEYLGNRPTYPSQLFQYIASKTPCHDVVWDVGTGSGQAIPPLAETFKTVIGTDTSSTQLELAPTFPNVRYVETPPTIPISDLGRYVSPESTVDLITVAQAVHWLDLPRFYEQVRWVLKKPDGVLAAWCYTIPKFGGNGAVDAAFGRFYAVDSAPFWEKERAVVDDRLRGIEFPFGPVEGVGSSTGPFEFWAEKEMGLEGLLQYVRSWSAYNTAKERGVELLGEEVVERLKRAWEEDGGGVKLAKFPVYLRIGKVGDCA